MQPNFAECLWKERSQSQRRQQDLAKLFLKLLGPDSLISVPVSVASGIMTLRQGPWACLCNHCRDETLKSEFLGIHFLTACERASLLEDGSTAHWGISSWYPWMLKKCSLGTSLRPTGTIWSLSSWGPSCQLLTIVIESHRCDPESVHGSHWLLSDFWNQRTHWKQKEKKKKLEKVLGISLSFINFWLHDPSLALHIMPIIQS